MQEKKPNYGVITVVVIITILVSLFLLSKYHTSNTTQQQTQTQTTTGITPQQAQCLQEADGLLHNCATTPTGYSCNPNGLGGYTCRQ